MKIFLSLLTVAGIGLATASAESSAPKKIKIPHQHQSLHGGTLLMLGDDHLEIAATKKAQTLTLYVSDKLRDPVAVSDVKLEVTLIQGTEKIPLSLEPVPGQTSAVRTTLPKGLASDASLEIRMPRVTPLKGSVSTNASQTIAISKLLNATAMDPHAGHHM
ncbi:MAG: hypothetical protein ABIR96_08715 [Bdellovibrionota bacterium]